MRPASLIVLGMPTINLTLSSLMQHRFSRVTMPLSMTIVMFSGRFRSKAVRITLIKMTRYPKDLIPEPLFEVRWMVEELRVSYFAQSLGVRGRSRKSASVPIWTASSGSSCLSIRRDLRGLQGSGTEGRAALPSLRT